MSRYFAGRLSGPWPRPPPAHAENFCSPSTAAREAAGSRQISGSCQISNSRVWNIKVHVAEVVMESDCPVLRLWSSYTDLLLGVDFQEQHENWQSESGY